MLYLVLLYSVLNFHVCLQNGSRWEHATPDSTWSQAEDAAGPCGSGSTFHPLPPYIQGNPQICSLQLHGAVRRFAACQMDHFFHGGKVKKEPTVGERACSRTNGVDQAHLFGICGQCSSFKSLMSPHSDNNNSWSDHVCSLIWVTLYNRAPYLCAFYFLNN